MNRPTIDKQALLKLTDEQREAILTEDEVMHIANDYNNLWKHGAITDKDHGQVEDLIVSHTALLSSEQAWREEAERLKDIDEWWREYSDDYDWRKEHLNKAVEVLGHCKDTLQDNLKAYQYKNEEGMLASFNRINDFLSFLSQGTEEDHK